MCTPELMDAGGLGASSFGGSRSGSLPQGAGAGATPAPSGGSSGSQQRAIGTTAGTIDNPLAPGGSGAGFSPTGVDVNLPDGLSYEEAQQGLDDAFGDGRVTVEEFYGLGEEPSGQPGGEVVDPGGEAVDDPILGGEPVTGAGLTGRIQGILSGEDTDLAFSPEETEFLLGTFGGDDPGFEDPLSDEALAFDAATGDLYTAFFGADERGLTLALGNRELYTALLGQISSIPPNFEGLQAALDEIQNPTPGRDDPGGPGPSPLPPGERSDPGERAQFNVAGGEGVSPGGEEPGAAPPRPSNPLARLLQDLGEAVASREDEFGRSILGGELGPSQDPVDPGERTDEAVASLRNATQGDFLGRLIENTGLQGEALLRLQQANRVVPGEVRDTAIRQPLLEAQASAEGQAEVTDLFRRAGLPPPVFNEDGTLRGFDQGEFGITQGIEVIGGRNQRDAVHQIYQTIRGAIKRNEDTGDVFERRRIANNIAGLINAYQQGLSGPLTRADADSLLGLSQGDPRHPLNDINIDDQTALNQWLHEQRDLFGQLRDADEAFGFGGQAEAQQRRRALFYR